MTQELNAQNVNTMPMGERLVSAGLLSDRDLERARLAKREMGCMLGEALVRLGLAPALVPGTVAVVSLGHSCPRRPVPYGIGF